MLRRSCTAKDKVDFEKGVDADLNWLKGQEQAASSAVPSSGSSHVKSAAGLLPSSMVSKRSSSMTGLSTVLHAGDCNTSSGLRWSKSGNGTTSLQYSEQHSPRCLQHRTSTITGCNSSAGGFDSRPSSKSGKRASFSATACLGDMNRVEELGAHLESISQQLNSFQNAVEELGSGNGLLQQRISERSAESQSAVAALLQHNRQLQQQLQHVLTPAQQPLVVSPAAHAVAITSETPGTSDGGASVASLTSNERRLVKFLKQLQKDKDRLTGQVQQLLRSHMKLLQQMHAIEFKTAAPQAAPQQCYCSPGTRLSSTWMTSSSTLHDEGQLPLQQQLDGMGPEQPGHTAAAASEAVPVVLYDTLGVSKDWLASRQLQSRQQQQLQEVASHEQCQRQELIENQAATIVELKKVIAELEQQTTVLRSQGSKQGVSASELSDCRATIAAQQAQIEEHQQNHRKLQELSQAAIRDAMRGAAAAEAERDRLQQQLQEEARKQAEVQNANEALATEVERLRNERQQLLLRLVEANEQITDLHDELGPALIRGSPSRRGSSITRASRVWHAAAAGCSSNGSPHGASGISQQLSAAVGESSDNTQALVAARVAAAKEVQDVQAACRELQQQYGELQARYHLLKEEHAHLLERQLGVASDRGSLRQQYLNTEEQYLAAKAQIVELQQELLLLKAQQPADNTSPATAAAAGRPDQGLLQQVLMSCAADNARLAVALAEIMQEQDSLREQLQQQAGGYDVPPPTAANDVQQQRLQLLISQLVLVRDQAAGTATMGQLQQENVQEQQQKIVQLTADMAQLQQQYAKLQRQHLQQAQEAVLGAVRTAAEPGSMAVAQVSEQNFKLQLELVSQAEQLRQLAAENESLRAAAIDRVVLEQLDAKNKVLLQEVTRLLSAVSDLRQQLRDAQPGADTLGADPAQSSIAGAPQAQQQQQQALTPLHSGVTGSPVSSRSTSRQPSLSMLAGDTSNVTRSPTLSQATSFQDQIPSDTAGLAGAASSATPSPFSVAAASVDRTTGGSGSTTPSALRSRSLTEGNRLQVSWSGKLRDDVAEAVNGGVSQRGSPLSSPKRMMIVSQLEQPAHGHDTAVEDAPSCTAAAAEDAGAAAAAAAATGGGYSVQEGIFSSRTWSGLQPTPHNTAPSPAATAAAAIGQSGAPNGPISELAAPQALSSNRAALVAAVLDRQQSKSSRVGWCDSSTAQPPQQQQQFEVNPAESGGRSNRCAAGLLQATSAAASADGSAAAAGQDRAALIAAVLQRQKAKQAGDSPSNSFAFAARTGNSMSGADTGFSRGGSVSGAFTGQGLAGPLQLQSPTGAAAAAAAAAGNDRASIVAAVLAQRQHKHQQQQGDSVSPVQASRASSPLAGSLPAASNAVRSSMASPSDRAALIAVVLAKHNLSK